MDSTGDLGGEEGQQRLVLDALFSFAAVEGMSIT
jgi:hypothetical protein